MSIKRLRIFAGPNGSGKSTFIQKLISEPPALSFKLGYYVNADDIEQILRKKGSLSFEQFGLEITTIQIQEYFMRSGFAPVRLENPKLWENFEIEKNQLTINKKQKLNSYIAADIAEFIRQNLLQSGYSFSYETVMSDKKKISFLRKAKKSGYRIYLYYFATEDPLININRVKVRMAQSGHAVKKEIIEKRYYKKFKKFKSSC